MRSLGSTRNDEEPFLSHERARWPIRTPQQWRRRAGPLGFGLQPRREQLRRAVSSTGSGRTCNACRSGSARASGSASLHRAALLLMLLLLLLEPVLQNGVDPGLPPFTGCPEPFDDVSGQANGDSLLRGRLLRTAHAHLLLQCSGQGIRRPKALDVLGLQLSDFAIRASQWNALGRAGHEASPETALAVLRRIQRQTITINDSAPITGVSTINRDQVEIFSAMSLRKPVPDAQLRLL